jgi:hypothetical protein
MQQQISSSTMMSIQNKGSFDRAMSNDQQDLVQLARGLRRIKRRLLLEHAGVALPATLVESKPKSSLVLVRSTSDGTEVTAVDYLSSPPCYGSSPIRSAMMMLSSERMVDDTTDTPSSLSLLSAE